MTTAAIAPEENLVRWHYLWYVAIALVVMTLGIASGDLWFLMFLHVMTGLLWTGIDLFMGFFVGPVLRQIELSARRAVLLRLVPRTLFLMPTLATITGTTGWFLAERLGYLDLPWPEFAWVAAALVIIGLLTLQGFGYLLPTNLRVCFELQKATPDPARIAALTKSYFFAVATQGVMQILMIVIMARFRAGL